jgi:RHS repeat-associated protein
VQWLISDHLGTPRLILDQTGSLNTLKRHDYLPFGEEISAGAGGRTTAMGYAAGDDVRQQFTQKERDIESGLDYFGARYYASTQGRFSSPDPLLSSGIEEDPQSWNRYSYTMNNPLALSDPTGLYVFDSSVDPKQRKKFNAGLAQAKANLEKIAATYGQNSKEYNQAKRAVDVYGAEGVKNGVTIYAAEGNDGTTQVAGVAGARTKDNPTGQDIRIIFNSQSFNSDSLSDVIGHEGSHAADGSDWVKSGFAANKNPGAYQSEVDGYTMQSLMAEANKPTGSNSVRLPYFKEPGKNPYLPERAPIWKSEWAGADRATLAAFRGSVDNILSRPTKAGGYDLTPASTKRAFLRGSAFPR